MKLEDKNIIRLRENQKKQFSELHDREIKRNPHEYWWYLRTDNTAYLRSTHPFVMAEKFFRSIAPKSVLNLGDSRGGAESVYFKSLGWKSIPCDYITSILKIAKEEVGFIDDYLEQNAENMTLESETYDYVITKESLHHMIQPYAGIYEMLRVAREGICIIEPRESTYKPGEERYEDCGNFVYQFSLKELAKTFTAMGYTEVCYRYIWETQTIIDECGQCSGEKFLQNKDKIQEKINEWYSTHDPNNGQLLMVFCFKKPPENKQLLIESGFMFLPIKKNKEN